MKLEQLGDKLEKASEKLADTKTDLEENAHQGFAEVKLTDRFPAGDGSCSKMDYLAEQGAGLSETCIKLEILAEKKVAAEAAGLESKTTVCSKLDYIAERQPDKAEPSGQEQEKAYEQFADTKTDLKKSAREAFEEVKLEDRPPAGDGSCKRLDYLAELHEETTDTGLSARDELNFTGRTLGCFKACKALPGDVTAANSFNR